VAIRDTPDTGRKRYRHRSGRQRIDDDDAIGPDDEARIANAGASAGLDVAIGILGDLDVAGQPGGVRNFFVHFDHLPSRIVNEEAATDIHQHGFRRRNAPH
jgi:hypothetical protein